MIALLPSERCFRCGHRLFGRGRPVTYRGRAVQACRSCWCWLRYVANGGDRRRGWRRRPSA